jgi:hypothetical protein
VEGAEVNATGRAYDPKAEVTDSQRCDLVGSEQNTVKHHAVPGLPHRPQDREDNHVARRRLHTGESVCDPVQKRR